MKRRMYHAALASQVILVMLFWPAAVSHRAQAFVVMDVVSGVIESPTFKGKDPIQKLRLAAELLHQKKLKQSDLALPLFDWADQYLREPADAAEGLKRWANLCNDEKLSQIRIPREFLNRILVAEYLVDQTPYLKSSPKKRLQLVGQLSDRHQLDPSVSLAYERLYAAGIITGAKTSDNLSPLESLKLMKTLKDQGLIGWQYRVPTEATLVAELLAMDSEYRKASPYDRLLKLRSLEHQTLITALTKRELEKLPAWRLMVHDPSFLAANQATKRKRLLKLKQEGLISDHTYTDLIAVFRPVDLPEPPEEASPAPLPEAKTLPSK